WTYQFYVFYYNVERQNVRSIEIKGIEEKLMCRDALEPIFIFTNHYITFCCLSYLHSQTIAKIVMSLEKYNNPVKHLKIIKGHTRSSKNSSTYVGGNSETLPIDLIIEILKRLPAKAIALCRCVSKEWDSLLSSPHFAKSFLTSSSTRPQLLFTFEFKGKWHFFSSPQLHFNENISVVAPDYHMGVSGDWYKEVCLSANGFVYLYEKQMLKGKMERVPVLCNPSTGQKIPLPKVRAKNNELRSFLGYDPIEKQFKFLCMTVTKYRRQINSREHHILTLGKGNPSWRKLECEFPHFPQNYRKGICINGILYYAAHNNFINVIACFNVKSEKFRFIQIDFNFWTLINYKGKLGVLVRDYSDNNQLWVLDDTEKGKWSKHILYFPDMIFWNIKSVWGTDTGEVVWAQWHWKKPFYVYFYNVERKSVRRVEIQGIEEKVFMDPAAHHGEVFTFPNHVENLMFRQ
ncbi:unnamed protein product, partial [Brassica rapa subsp. narinosa]